MSLDRISAFAAVIVALLMGHASASAAEEKLTFFRIGSGPTTETLYALGASISAGISRPPGSAPCNQGGVCGVPGLIAVAQSRSGSIENIFAMMRGELDSALVRADVAFQAYHGRGPFRYEGAQPDLRVIANLTPVQLHIAVGRDSGIKSVRDLRGKRLSVGARGSGTRSFALIVLRMHGLDATDLQLRYLKPSQASDALVAGDLDAIFMLGAAPIQAITELSRQTPIRLLDLGGYARRQLISLYPFVDTVSIPTGNYPGVESAESVKMNVQWVVWRSAKEALIQDITRALWLSDTRDLFIRNNPDHVFPPIQEGVPQSGVPVHRGAMLYYRAAGIVR